VVAIGRRMNGSEIFIGLGFAYLETPAWAVQPPTLDSLTASSLTLRRTPGQAAREPFEP
jgi:hypothetical protein